MRPLQVTTRERFTDGLVAGVVAAVPSGLPSTLLALMTGGDALEATRAAGTIVAPDDAPGAVLLAAAVPVHGALSLTWGGVVGILLPPGREIAGGIAAGVAIAALDLGVFGRRLPRIRALPVIPQVLDHVAFGAIVGAVVSVRRAARAGGTASPRARRRGRAPTPSRAVRRG